MRYRYDDDDDDDRDLGGGGGSTCTADPDPPPSALREFLMPRSPSGKPPSDAGDHRGRPENGDDTSNGGGDREEEVDATVGVREDGIEHDGEGEDEEYGYDDELDAAGGQHGLFSQPPPPTPPPPPKPGAMDAHIHMCGGPMDVSLGLTENDDEDDEDEVELVAASDDDGTPAGDDDDDDDHRVDEMTGSASASAGVDTRGSSGGSAGARAPGRVGRGVFDTGRGGGHCDDLGLTEDPTQSSSSSSSGCGGAVGCGLPSDSSAPPLALAPAARRNDREYDDDDGDDDHDLPGEEQTESSSPREVPIYCSSQEHAAAAGVTTTKAESSPAGGGVASRDGEGTSTAAVVEVDVDVHLTDATPLFPYPREGRQQSQRRLPSQQPRGVGVGSTLSGDTTVLNTPLTTLTPRKGAGGSGSHDGRSHPPPCRSPNLLSMVADTNPQEDGDGCIRGDVGDDGDDIGDRGGVEDGRDGSSMPLRRQQDDRRRQVAAVRAIVGAMRMQRDRVRYFLVRTVLIWIQRRWREIAAAEKKPLAASASSQVRHERYASERGIGRQLEREAEGVRGGDDEDAPGDDYDDEETMTESPPHSYFDRQQTEALPPPPPPLPPPRAEDVVAPMGERDPAEATPAGMSSGDRHEDCPPPRGGADSSFRENDDPGDDDAAGGKKRCDDDGGGGSGSPQVSVLLGDSQQGSTSDSSGCGGGGSLTLSLSCPTHYDGETQTFACGAVRGHVGSEGKGSGEEATPGGKSSTTPATSKDVVAVTTPSAPSPDGADRRGPVGLRVGDDPRGPGTTDRSTPIAAAAGRLGGVAASSPPRATDGGGETTGRGSDDDGRGEEGELGGCRASDEPAAPVRSPLGAGTGGAGGTGEVGRAAATPSVARQHAPSIPGAASGPRGGDQVDRGEGRVSARPAMAARAGTASGGGVSAAGASAAGSDTCTRGNATVAVAAVQGGGVLVGTDILARIGEATGTSGAALCGSNGGGAVDPSQPPEPVGETLVEAKSKAPSESDGSRRGASGEEVPPGTPGAGENARGARTEGQFLGPDGPHGGIPMEGANVDSGIDHNPGTQKGKSPEARGIQRNTSDDVEQVGNHAVGDVGADVRSRGGHAQAARREEGANASINSSTPPCDAREKGAAAKSPGDGEDGGITAREEMEAPPAVALPRDREEGEASWTTKNVTTANEDSSLVNRPSVPARAQACCPAGGHRTGHEGPVEGDPDATETETETVVCSTIADTICTPNDASSENAGRANGEHEGTEQNPDMIPTSIRRTRVTFDVSDEEEHIASPPPGELSSSPHGSFKEQTPLLPLPSIDFRALTMGSADKAHGEVIGKAGSEKKAAGEGATSTVVATVSRDAASKSNQLERSKNSGGGQSLNPAVNSGTSKTLKSKTTMKTLEKENSIPPITDRNRPMMKEPEWLSTRRTTGQKHGKLRESNMSPSPLLGLPGPPLKSPKKRASVSANEGKDGDSISGVAYDAVDHGLQDTQEEEVGRGPSNSSRGKTQLSRMSRGCKLAINCQTRGTVQNGADCLENVDNTRDRTEAVDDGERTVAEPKQSPRKRKKTLARGLLPRGCSARHAERSKDDFAKTTDQRRNSVNCSLQNFGNSNDDLSTSHPKRLKVVVDNPQADVITRHGGDDERELFHEGEGICSRGEVALEDAPGESDASLTQGEMDLNALREEQKSKLEEGQRSVQVLEKRNEELAATLARRREEQIRREQCMVRQEVARLKEENVLLRRDNSKHKRKYSKLEEARQDDEKLMQQLSEEKGCLKTQISLLQQCMKDVLTRYGATDEGRTDVSFISDMTRACDVSPFATEVHQDTSTTPKISNRVSTSSSGATNGARASSKKSPQKKQKGAEKKRTVKVTEPRPSKGKKKRVAVGAGNKEKCVEGGRAKDGAAKKAKLAKGTKLQFADCDNAASNEVQLQHCDEPQGIKRREKAIAADEETIAASVTFQEAWALLQEHGWVYRAGPEPYNQVYVPPGGATKMGSKDGVNFFACPKEMMEKAREMGHLVDVEQQSADEEDAECFAPSRTEDDNESESSDDEHDEKEAVGVAWSLLQERGWMYKMGPQPYNKVYVPPGGTTKKGSEDGVHFFSCPRLAMEKAQVMGHLVEKEQQQSDESNDEKDDPDPEQMPVGQIEAEENLHKHNEDAVTENVVSSSSESESDSEVAVLHSNFFSSASLRRCARYMRKFCRSSDDRQFRSQLWSPIWSALREQGGGNKKKCWSYKENRGNSLGSSWVFATPNSKGARHGIEGKDYFSSERAVVARVLQELLCVFPDLVDEPSMKRIRSICSEESNDAVDALSFAEHAYANAAEAGNVALTVRCRRGRKPSFKARQELGEKADSRPAERCTDREKNVEAKPKSSTKGETGAPPNDAVALSQNTLAGAEMLLGMQREAGHGQPQFEAEEDDDDDTPLCKLATPLTKRDAAVGLSSYSRVGTDAGVCAVLALRKEKQQRARQAERVKKPINRKIVQVSAANGLERRTMTSVGSYHLTQSPQHSEDEDETQESFTSPIKVGANGDENAPLLRGLEFLLSGVPPHVKKDIVRLGGRVVDVLSDIPLDLSEIGGRLFFLSEPNCRRRLKYAFAVSLGLPMLHYGVVEELEKRDAEFKLQESDDGRARHAKLWLAPGAEKGGKPVFAGMRLVVALEDKGIEKDWCHVLKASGATIMSTSQALKIDHARPDAVLVDCLSLPPHTTAAPPPVSKALNAVKKHDGTMTPVVDLSWAIQCIVQRARLDLDSNRRFKVLPDSSEIFSLKVKQGAIMHRYEVGDAVRFGHRSEKENYGRIRAIKPSPGRRGGRLLEVSVLEPHGRHSLVDDSNSVTMTLCDDQLISQVILLSAKDFKYVKHGYATKPESNIFMQKQKASARK